MRLPKRGEKGFTLIELLIVVAILGVLAAVVIPNVGRFLGRGEDEARRTEFHNVSSAVIAMMVDNSLTTIPGAVVYVTTGTAQNQLGFVDGTPDQGFPDFTTTVADKATAEGYTWSGGTDPPYPGYVLYRHDKPTAADNYTTISYVSMSQTTYYYTCETDGTVRQFNIADLDGAGITEYTY